MRSGGNNFNYFPESKLTKLANFVQFIRMLCFVWRIRETGGPLSSRMLKTTDTSRRTWQVQNEHIMTID